MHNLGSTLIYVQEYLDTYIKKALVYQVNIHVLPGVHACMCITVEFKKTEMDG